MWICCRCRLRHLLIKMYITLKGSIRSARYMLVPYQIIWDMLAFLGTATITTHYWFSILALSLASSLTYLLALLLNLFPWCHYIFFIVLNLQLVFWVVNLGMLLWRHFGKSLLFFLFMIALGRHERSWFPWKITTRFILNYSGHWNKKIK